MNICVISHSFPTSKTIDFVFVDQLCRQFADKGAHVIIIAPQSITKCIFRHIPIVRYRSIITTDSGNIMVLLRPIWISLGSEFTSLVGNTFNMAVRFALNHCKERIDVLYGHFWAQAIAALPYAKKHRIPLFAVAGEGKLDTHHQISKRTIDNVRDTVCGCICVATKSKNESVAAGFVTEEKCTVIPNAVNPNLFYPRNRNAMRAKYGFPVDSFIVVFVGQWNSRKGVSRLSEALTRLDNPNIKAIFIGRGSEYPTYKYTVFQGQVNHNILPEFLSCADIFALPTNNEGCSNAVIEALACGLPVVSSDMEFNWDVLNDDNSILWDPYDIDAIAESINRIYSDKELCDKLHNGALLTAAGLSLSIRADKILAYISNQIIRTKNDK